MQIPKGLLLVNFAPHGIRNTRKILICEMETRKRKWTVGKTMLMRIPLAITVIIQPKKKEMRNHVLSVKRTQNLRRQNRLRMKHLTSSTPSLGPRDAEELSWATRNPTLETRWDGQRVNLQTRSWMVGPEEPRIRKVLLWLLAMETREIKVEEQAASENPMALI